mmetsp:Transcript_24095/g.36613  ORF Transcript_24095/g.36613 Transcript_24095/m.36613 type:complete len:139 (+) Transcript_24095:863-1279(+)
MHIDNQSVVDLINLIQRESNEPTDFNDLPDLEATMLTEGFRDEISNIQYDALRPDWDLIRTIGHLIKSPCFRNFNIVWIASHQDNKTPYPKLPLPAQLNVEADALASRIQKQPKSNKYHIVPITAFCNTHLDIDSKSR